MGGVNSCLVPRNQNPNPCRENHTSTPKAKTHRRNLSAAFNLADMGNEANSGNQLNINTATEEELMTLPLINRTTAHNIVDYRSQIGGFKKVEDLALVSGVGANKLNLIRLEICVGRKKSSTNSSRTSSKNDLSGSDLSSSSQRQTSSQMQRQNSNGKSPKINVNTSNVFQLMKVKGVSQSMAENIVAYREKRGRYRRLDDLVKVKGITYGFLSAVRPQLCLFTDTLSPPIMSSVSYHGQKNGSSHVTSHTRAHSYTGGFELGDINQNPLLGSQDDLLNSFGPLSRRSMRVQKRPPVLVREHKTLVRIATWNLQNCSNLKAENPGVKEVVAMTLLENGISILAVQELMDPEALAKICDELNNPIVPNVKKWPGTRGQWSYVVSDLPIGDHSQKGEYLGFLYNCKHGVELVSTTAISLIKSSLCELPSVPFCGMFRVNGDYFVIVNVHWKLENGKRRESFDGGQCGLQKLSFLQQASMNDESLSNSVIILGDIGSMKTTDTLSQVEAMGFSCVSPTEAGDGDVASTSSHQIFINSQSKNKYTGESGNVTEGLTNPWIPDGWNWGGAASIHSPVWAELYVNQPTNHALNI